MPRPLIKGLYRGQIRHDEYELQTTTVDSVWGFYIHSEYV